MITNIDPYPKMKDSRVEWIGDVPAHWEVRRLAQFGKLSRGRGGNKDDDVATGVPCVRYGDLYTTHHHFIRESRSFIPKEKTVEYANIKFGDVLFASSGETIDQIGKSAVNLMQQDACCGGDVIMFRPAKTANARYLGYALDCRPAAIQKATMGRGITVMHVYGTQLRYLTIPLPPLVEQSAIVRFLDHVDQRIHRYIRAKLKLIALLKEQKQAMIHQAVTGQIDVGTGQPYPAYKPSRVEWLGDVPAHWEIRKLSWLFRFCKGSNAATLTREYIGRRRGPFPVYSGQTENGGMMGTIDSFEFEFPGPVILVTTVGAKAMSTRTIEARFSLSQNCALIVPRDSRLDIGYYEGLLRRMFAFERRSVSLIMQPSLRFEDLYRFRIAIPSVDEQQAISRFIVQCQAETDSVVARTSNVMKRLSEYWVRLVADVVTGQVDVREVSSSLAEADQLVAGLGVSQSLGANSEVVDDELNWSSARGVAE